MMPKTRKNQINARVDNDTNDALQRQAAALGATAGGLASEILAEYVARQQTVGAKSGVFDEVSQQFDERLAEHDRRLMGSIETVIKPLRKEITVLKAQLDVIAEFIAPGRRDEYQHNVAKLIQMMGIQTNGGRP